MIVATKECAVSHEPTLLARFMQWIMRKYKISQSRLETESGISSSMIGCIKRGERVPVLEKLPSLASALSRLTGEDITHRDLAYLIQAKAWGKDLLEDLAASGISPNPQLASAIVQLQERLEPLGFVKLCQSHYVRAEDIYAARSGYLPDGHESRAVLSLIGESVTKNLIKEPLEAKMQVHPPQGRSMPEIPPDLPNLPSLISGLLLRLLEETDLDRTSIANELAISRSRVEELIATRTPVSSGEYAAIATLVNHYFGTELTAQTLRESKEAWDIAAGRVNGNGVS